MTPSDFYEDLRRWSIRNGDASCTLRSTPIHWWMSLHADRDMPPDISRWVFQYDGQSMLACDALASIREMYVITQSPRGPFVSMLLPRP